MFKIESMESTERLQPRADLQNPGELYEVDDESLLESLAGQEKMLAMETGQFIAGQWAATAEQKLFL